ncbi:lysine N(6)-hydroxylase/L-ornithine N(5)-oxygenase family protein [Streptomyces sp. NPDC001222]|uniref:lysine N(6)-hydroxylase/L-ornithine N(5)-oxygenase family protein n=1 Tax=Streptomyces sp. NPDC001222 TaxID=3364548 RepID=UPI0036A7FF92
MNDHTDTHILDYVAVGVGPANMSLAALAHPIDGLRARHLERRESFSWHPGLLLPEATLQVSPLKDLVTLVDPTSPFSFLSFLAAHGRLYRFLAAQFPAVLRAEFNQYLQWVAGQLPAIVFGAEVREVDFHSGAFRVRTADDESAARHLVLGTGPTPNVPVQFREHLGKTVFHSGEFLPRLPDVTGLRVAVVGGGQSGAEVVRHLAAAPAAPATITWISRRPSFQPMDDSPFANDLYTPDYVRRFHALPDDEKARLLELQTLTSDGVDLPILRDIHQLSYRADFLDGTPGRLRFLPDTDVTALAGTDGDWKLTLDGQGGDTPTVVGADIVVLCTGYGYRIPDFMAPMLPLLHRSGQHLEVQKDFSVAWDGPVGHRIYLQNGARHAWGVADPNLSLLAWRSAVILNSILGETRYPV